MSATKHEHEFVWTGDELLPCACGANLSAIETALGAAADDARRIVGDAHYTGCRVCAESETLELWLCAAPARMLQELERTRPGVYAIHNDAPHPLGELLELMNSIDVRALRSDGINVTQIGPRNDGYLWVGVNTDIAAARERLEAEYGPGLFRFFTAEPLRMTGAGPEAPRPGRVGG